MPALVAGIHVLLEIGKKDVDGRDKPGHDEGKVCRVNSMNPAIDGINSEQRLI